MKSLKLKNKKHLFYATTIPNYSTICGKLNHHFRNYEAITIVDLDGIVIDKSLYHFYVIIHVKKYENGIFKVRSDLIFYQKMDRRMHVKIGLSLPVLKVFPIKKKKFKLTSS